MTEKNEAILPPVGKESPGDDSPTLRRARVRVRVSVLVQSMQLLCSAPLILSALAHTQTKDHLGQISPVEARGEERSADVRAGKRVTPGMLNISSHLFSPPSSSDAAAWVSVCSSVLEGCGVWNECAQERRHT